MNKNILPRQSDVGKAPHTPNSDEQNSVEINTDRLAQAMTAALKILNPGTNATVRVVKRVSVESNPHDEVSV